MDDPTLIIARHDTEPGRRPPFWSLPPAGPREWARRGLVALAVLLVAGALSGLVLLYLVSQGLPDLAQLDRYDPPQATVVHGSGGEVVARFAQERRTVVPFEKIPKIMVEAVLAAEDSDFYTHQGVDYQAILRCVLINVTSGRARCGGSTITQQMVKTFFLTPEKTLVRKLQELVLAKRVEEALSKQHILYLYLNQIYFGHGAYGVQEASRVYFGKDVGELRLEEAALLAGLPQSPTRHDPYRNPERARERRGYVLGRLLETGKISEAVHARAAAAPIELAGGGDESHLDNENHFVDHVRRLLAEHPLIGEDELLGGGLTIHTGLDPVVQAAADRALANGVREIDKRQGWRGPLLHLDAAQAVALGRILDIRRQQVAPDPADEGKTLAPVVWDLARLGQAPKGADVETLADLARTPRFEKDKIFGGIVVEVEDAQKQAVVSLGGPVRVVLTLKSGLAWARPFDVEKWTARPKRPSEVVAVGDVVLVRATGPVKGEKHRWVGMLEQVPLTQAAVVVIDPSSREVRALAGGYGVGAGTFNRATQARRQAGSTFKPVLYAAAFETRKFTPVSTCDDAPIVERDPWTGKAWKPQNYDGKFEGEITLRKGLTLSKNLCSVWLIQRVGVEPVLDMAERLGVKSPMPRNFTLALGSGDVTPLEMVNAYVTLADGGRQAEPIFVRKVASKTADIIPDVKAAPEQRVDPAVAYLVTSLMQSVVDEGTATRVKSLERPVAGKTGTSNEARNAWFIGYTPTLVTGVWVGFDDNRPLGPGETGGRAAIPIWLDVMRVALDGEPPLEFVAPGDVVFATVDPKTGKLAPQEYPDARDEPFLVGTEPTELVETATPSKPIEQVLMEEYE